MPLNVAILGMGDDGHTASFFPGGDNLQVALNEERSRLVSMRAPGAAEPRITLSRRTLLQARSLYLHVEGEDKAGVLERALTPGSIEDLPVRSMLHQDHRDIVIYLSR